MPEAGKASYASSPREVGLYRIVGERAFGSAVRKGGLRDLGARR